MNFQQLRIIREAARRDYNLTEVAIALFTSQTGVSRHIRELEEELGIELFIRYGKRLLGMTEPGKELLVIAERILNDANNIRKLADTGITQVVVTHEVEFARRVATQVIYLEQGQIVEMGSAQHFVEPQTVRFAEFLQN